MLRKKILSFLQMVENNREEKITQKNTLIECVIRFTSQMKIKTQFLTIQGTKYILIINIAQRNI